MKILSTGILLLGVVSAFALTTPAKFNKFYRGASAQPQYKTEAEVNVIGDDLVFTVKCFQPKGSISAKAKLHDRDVYKDDCVEIYIDKEGKAKDYQQYIINPFGTLQDLRFRNFRWDSDAAASGKISNDFWLVTLRVPLSEVACDNEVANGNACIRFNICRSVTSRKYGESLLPHGAYSKMREFLKLELKGVTPAKLKQLYLAKLKKKGINTAKIEKLNGAKFYEAGALEEERVLKKNFKILPTGMSYYFASSTNVIPNPKFEYVNRKGEPANWIKQGVGECRRVSGVLELRSGSKLEFWQETQPILDNKRVYALRGKVRSLSGKNRFKINLTGVDRSARQLNVEKVVRTLESPMFANTGKWLDVEFTFELPKSAFRADAAIVVENGILQVKEVELDLLGKEDREIIVSQLGYHQNGYKDAVFWSRKGGLKPDFELLQNGKTVYRGKAVRHSGRPYEREAFTADFSKFRGEGVFRLKTNGMTSNPFKIGKNVYMDGMRFMLNGYYYQRQGFAQPGWKKKPDYKDDAYVVSLSLRGKDDILYLPDGRINPKHILGHHDVSGGWRDAGDCSKQGTDGDSIYMLARILYRLNPQWNLRKGAMKDLPDELWWGTSRWTDKLYMGDGTFLDTAVNVTKLSHKWVYTAPDECTDGIPNTADDRIVYAIRTADGKYRGFLPNQWTHIHAIGMAGIAMRKTNPEIAKKCANVMEGYYRKMKELYEKQNLAHKKKWNVTELTRTGSKLGYTAIYLHQLTGKEEYRTMVDQIIVKMMSMAKQFDAKKEKYNSPYNSVLHYFNILPEYAEFYPNSKYMPELKRAITTYIDKLVLPGFDQKALFPTFTLERLGKKYGKNDTKNVVSAHTLAALTLLRAGRITNVSKYNILAEKALQFWFGRNPQNLCEISGMGWRYTALMTGLAPCKGHEDAVIPGLMGNGFRSLNFMPIPAKPAAVTPGGNMSTAYGVEAYIVPTGMVMGLMSELEQIYTRSK